VYVCVYIYMCVCVCVCVVWEAVKWMHLAENMDK